MASSKAKSSHTPFSLEAEQAVIGSLLLDPSGLNEVAHLIGPDDFYSERLGWLFEAILDLTGRGIAPDVLTATQALEQRGRLADAGGAAFVIGLINQTPSSLNVAGYARIVAELAYRRRLIEAAGTIARLAHADTLSLVEIHERSTQALLRLAGRAIHTHATARQVFERELADLLRRVEDARGGRRHAGWDSGLPEWDAVFEGEFRPGSYTLLFGPTGVGKTWAMLQMALAAARQGPVVYISLENLEDSIRARLLAVAAGVPFSGLRDGSLSDEALAACRAVLADLAALPFELVTHLERVSQIEAHLKAAGVRLGAPGIAFIDTLNELADSQSRDSRYENLTRASARLLATMRATGWGIVAAAQQRNDLWPGMHARKARARAYPVKSALEGARTMAQHVSTLIGMYSPEWVARETANPAFFDPDCPRGQVMFVNVKARDARGAIAARVKWNPDIPRFEGK